MPAAVPAVPSYLAFVLRSDDKAPTAISLGSADKIEAQVLRWRQEVGKPVSGSAAAQQRESDYSNVAVALRQSIWDPVAPFLQGVGRVILVPDGALHLVNFGALPVGSGRYLVEEGPPLHYLSAERDVAGLSGERSQGAGLIVLGAPMFDDRPAPASKSAVLARPAIGSPAQTAALRSFRGEPSKCDDVRTKRFWPLKSAALETEDVVAIWNKAHASSPSANPAIALLGLDAGEAVFKRLAPGKEALHLANHGFFLGGRCAPISGAPRNDGGQTTTDLVMPPPIVGDNPLVLCGLALAGANQRELAGPDDEDGVVTAEEIAALDLAGVGWAVLSACDTGVGELQAGEGVLGLRRAFEVAGVRTLIMSLWPVQDLATRRWMAALYEARFSKGMGTAEAVRDASLAVLNERRARGQSTHPFYWAGFVAAGDWR